MKFTSVWWHSFVKVDYHPEPEVDLRDALRYCESVRQDLAARFIDSISSSTRVLGVFPKIGYHLNHKGTRRIRVRGFPYNLLYQISPDHILVIAVAHQNRDARYRAHRV
ncbi:type II toxin-antitoxin system RelE/ParE family toxin [Acanthopleuribacter pedis]